MKFDAESYALWWRISGYKEGFANDTVDWPEPVRNYNIRMTGTTEHYFGLLAQGVEANHAEALYLAHYFFVRRLTS